MTEVKLAHIGSNVIARKVIKLQLLFADQLGPHFQQEQKLLLPEVLSQFSKRKYHRQKAHLILSAVRHRGLDPEVELVSVSSYRDLKGSVDSVINPTSYNQRKLANELGLEIHSSRGFVASEQDFSEYVEAKKGKRLVLEDFYRKQRLRTGLLIEGGEPEGGQWNFDHDNRLPPPKQQTLGATEPWYPKEDEIDQQVRKDLDELEGAGVEFAGEDGPRLFPASRSEALEALEHFVNSRLDLFGPYEDAVLKDDWAMSHSLLSAPMNMGLLDPLEVAKAAERAYKEGKARIASVEGFIRQVIGWRDYVWHLYWHFGEQYVDKNELNANTPLPDSWLELAGADIESNCLSSTIGDISKRGWAHHIPRLMIIGNIAMQRGFHPKQVNDWLVDNFVDGTPWVMPANSIGMSLYADGGMMSSKPYAAGGSYINKMTNYCGSCRFDPKTRVGEDACPVNAGYWFFIHNHQDRLISNPRISRSVYSMRKLSDIDELVAQESQRKKL